MHLGINILACERGGQTLLSRDFTNNYDAHNGFIGVVGLCKIETPTRATEPDMAQVHNEHYRKTRMEWSDDFALRSPVMPKTFLPIRATPAVARVTHQTQLWPYRFLPDHATAYIRPAASAAFPT